MTASALTWLLGIWLIVRGLLELAGAAVGSGTTGRGFLVATGVVDLALGALFAANPGRSAVGIAWLLGLVAIVWGVVFLVIGLVARKQLRDLDDTAGAAAPGLA